MKPENTEGQVADHAAHKAEEDVDEHTVTGALHDAASEPSGHATNKEAPKKVHGERYALK